MGVFQQVSLFIKHFWLPFHFVAKSHNPQPSHNKGNFFTFTGRCIDWCYHHQERMSLRQKSIPWHDFLCYGDMVTRTHRETLFWMKLAQQKKHDRKQCVRWNRVTGSMQMEGEETKRLGYPSPRWSSSHGGCQHGQGAFGSSVLMLWMESMELLMSMSWFLLHLSKAAARASKRYQGWTLKKKCKIKIGKASSYV